MASPYLYQPWRTVLALSLHAHPGKSDCGDTLLSLNCNLTLPVGILPFLHPVVPNLAKRSSEVRNQDLKVLTRKSEQLLSEWAGGPEDFRSHVFPRCNRNSTFLPPHFPRYLQTAFDFCSFPLSHQKTLMWPWLPQDTQYLCTNYREESCLLP